MTMDDSLIINAAEDEEEYPAIARLIELGRQKTYVTSLRKLLLR
jgi:RNA polymerase primary sigma factor